MFQLQSSAILESAFGILLNHIALQITSHSVCILTKSKDVNLFHLKDFPTVRSRCEIDDNFSYHQYSHQLIWGVNHGCAFFMVSQDCVNPFIDTFYDIHVNAIPKFSPKVMLVVDHQKIMTNETVLNILQNEVVRTAIPQTIIVQPNQVKGNENEIWLNVWKAFPFSIAKNVTNRFFLSNQSLEQQDKLFVKFISDLDRIEVVQGVFDYPPFTKTRRVATGEGNANIYGSPEKPLSAMMEGLESRIIVEFCLHYNCIVSARLDYDVTLWGWGYSNRTGTGVLGGITKYEIDLTGCGCFIMGHRYNGLQYTVPIQQSKITHFLPKPKPLPPFYTPLLPFPFYTWITVLFVFIVGVTFLCCFSVAAKKTSSLIDGTEKHHNIIDTFFIVLKMNLFQNVHIKTKIWSKIVMMGTLLASSLIIGNMYTGGLSKVMTITPYETPIDTLEKLVKTNLIWGETSLTWIMAIIESPYPPHQKYAKKFIEELNLTKIHKWVSEQKMAVIVDQMQDDTLILLDYVNRNDSKSLMIMKQALYYQYTTIITTKTWPWIEQLNRIVSMQQESGIWRYWTFKAAVSTTDYTIQRNMEENSKNQENIEAEALTVNHILGPLFLILFGYSIAGLTFAVELLWTKHLKKITVDKWKKKNCVKPQ